MSNNDDYLGTASNKNFRLSGDILMLMLKGAAYAAVFCLVVWFSIAAMAWIGKMLPDESRETEDPTPYSFYLIESALARTS